MQKIINLKDMQYNVNPPRETTLQHSGNFYIPAIEKQTRYNKSNSYKQSTSPGEDDLEEKSLDDNDWEEGSFEEAEIEDTGDDTLTLEDEEALEENATYEDDTPVDDE